MVQYGISIVESDADMQAVEKALADLPGGVELAENSNQVYVDPMQVGEAVRLINALGYSTDEDEDA